MPSMDQFSQNVQSQALVVPQQEFQEPFFLKALGSLPGVSQMAALNAGRFSNTMFKGGYLDTASGATGIRQSIGKRTGAFIGGNMGDASDYALGKNVFGKFSSNKAKSAAMSNLNPFGATRFDSVARLTGLTGKSAPYNPFQGVAGLVDWAMKPDFIRKRAAARYGDDVINNAPPNTLYTGGVFGRIQTADKAMGYEKAVSKADDLRASLGGRTATRSQQRVLNRGTKAADRLTKLDDSIVKLGKLTKADFAVKGATSYIGSASGIGTSNLASGVLDSMVSSTLKTGAADAAIASNVSNIGRVRAIYETIPGELSKSIFGHYNIMNNAKYGDFADTAVGKRTLNSFSSAMEKYRVGAAGKVDDVGHISRTFMSAHGGAGYADDAADVLKGGAKTIRSTSATLAKEAFKAGDKATAIKMGGQYASTYGKVAGKAFSAYGYATLAYDIGKGVGNMMMGGVNFAKDAMKSMQGTINKPIFGAGFKDNEVAATSRARGVMAIQNSRLNARSMLGSEGGMMAAHFG
jgi:hypothetical protein